MGQRSVKSSRTSAGRGLFRHKSLETSKGVGKSHVGGDQKWVVLCVDPCNWLLKEIVGARSLQGFWESAAINGREMNWLPLGRQKPHQELGELETTGVGSKRERCTYINRDGSIIYT